MGSSGLEDKAIPTGEMNPDFSVRVLAPLHAIDGVVEKIRIGAIARCEYGAKLPSLVARQ